MRNINSKEENILAVRCFVPYTQLFTYFDDVFLAYPLKTDENISDSDFPTAFILHEDNNKDKYIFLDANLFHKQEWRSDLLPFVLLHELMHGKLKHITRFRNYFKRNRFLANITEQNFNDLIFCKLFNIITSNLIKPFWINFITEYISILFAKVIIKRVILKIPKIPKILKIALLVIPLVLLQIM